MGVRTDRQSPTLECLQQLTLQRRDRAALDRSDAVKVQLHRAFRGNSRIQHAEGARSRIARIHKHFLATLASLFVHQLEALAAHEAFPASLHHRGSLAAQLVRHGANLADVGRNVLAPYAIASSRSLRELAIPVNDRDGKSVELWLRPVVELALDRQSLMDAAIKGLHVLICLGIVQ